MPDEVREYIRAAQQAELRGDRPQAVELLKKAAAMVRSGGNHQRALQLLRHAQRLDGGAQQELADEIRRLEWLPDKPFLRAVEDEERETEDALGPLKDLDTSDRRMFDRGPTLADPELAAWCSFCCRPRTEVGDLVAGPAGAFICAACLRESMRLLDAGRPVPASLSTQEPPPPAPASPEPSAPTPVPEEGPAPPASPPEHARPPEPSAPTPVPEGGSAPLSSPSERARPPKPPSAPPPEPEWVPLPLPQLPPMPPTEPPSDPPELVGQREAVELVQRGLELGVGWILVVGPEGSGKTTFLRSLERRGAGRYLSAPAAAKSWGDERLLVDGLDAAGRGDAQIRADALGRVPRVVLAVRGSALPPPLWASSESGDLPIHSTRALLEACGEALPPAVAERIQLAVSFRAPSAEELAEIARRLLVARASELDLSDDLLAAIAAEAARSPRGAHELRALLDRIPAGSWSLKAAPGGAAAGRRRRGKGAPSP